MEINEKDFGVAILLSLILGVLKLFVINNMSWFVVFSPIILLVLFILAFMLILLLMGAKITNLRIGNKRIR